jgi:hypothetical protein
MVQAIIKGTIEKTMVGSNAVSLPSHMCPTSERQRGTSVQTGSDMCVLTLDQTFSN